MRETPFCDFEGILGLPAAKTHEGHIRQIITDSRQIRNAPSCLFVALKGPWRDGHDFVIDAFEKGVRQFLVEKLPDERLDAGFYVVPSTVNALQQIAAYNRQLFDYPVIGITGSNGKTIVKEWLAPMLGQAFNVVKSPKSYNSQIGVPLSLLEMADKHNLGIFEAGISQPNEMPNLERMIRPTIGIFTNIGEAHAEGFTSKIDKARSKAQLFANSQLVICRHEHLMVREVLGELNGPQVLTWSTQNNDADILIEGQDLQSVISWGQERAVVTLPFHQEPFVENLLHAVTCAMVLRVKEEQIQQGIRLLPSVDMRLSLKKGINDSYLIDDSYNNDLIGLQSALETQSAQRTLHRKKALILSEVLQTGLEQAEVYARVKQMLLENHIDRFFAIGFDQVHWQADPDGVDCHFYESTQDFLNHMPPFREELILIKGARPFGFERIVGQLAQQRHRTQLSVSFESLRKNLMVFKGLLRPETKVMVMVKAFAYGGGAVEIANFLQYQGVNYLGVAYFDEGRLLREHGIDVPIMVMNPSVESLGDFKRYELEPVIYNMNLLKEILSLPTPPFIHLEMETGMNRLGFGEEEFAQLLGQLPGIPPQQVKSIFTHLATSEDLAQQAFTDEQLSLFDSRFDELTEVLGYTPIKHALNTGGIVTKPSHQYDMVRLGIGLYGIDPVGQLSLESVGKFSTYVSQIKHLKKGESVGYGRRGTIERDSKIATIPVGYADGYLRAFGNGVGKVNVGGVLAPTIGNICMDMSMIDVTEIACEVGQEVVLMGANPHITDLAQWANTIPYEILTNISPRVERVYSWL